MESTHDHWLAIATPIAIIVAAIVQRLDAIIVKKTLKKETSRLRSESTNRDAKLSAIHRLVNGSMKDQKKVSMIFAKRIAAITNDPLDIEIAQQAEQDFIEYAENLDTAGVPSVPSLVCDRPDCPHRTGNII